MTNSRAELSDLVPCHEGRGSQEGLFAEMKSENAPAYVPTGTCLGNRAYMAAVTLAHNLTRELTMASAVPSRARTEKRAALWVFPRIATVRRHLIQRAGRLIRPRGRLTLSMSANDAVGSEIEATLENLERVG